MPRGRKKTTLENVRELQYHDLKDGKDEALFLAYCIALKVLTPDEARQCKNLDYLTLRPVIKKSKAKRIAELEKEEAEA